MGGRKQFHPWQTSEGEKPLVAAAFDAIANYCSEMVVVLGHRAEEVAAALQPRKFSACVSDPDAPMFASVQTGIGKSLESNRSSAVLLHPGDHPAVAATTLETLLNLQVQHPEWVLIPEYQGRGGHPVLIPNKIASSLLTADCPSGLGHYWSQHAELCLRVSVEDASVVKDVDYASKE